MKKAAFLITFLCIGVFVSDGAFAHEDPYEVKKGYLTGQIVVKGNGPMQGGTVYFFNEESGPPPSATRYWRVPDEAFAIDKNGRFTAALPAGRYYMGAIRKTSGDSLGSPQDGDLFYIGRGEKGFPQIYSVRKGEFTDIGIISGAEPFSRSSLEKEGITSIEGTVLDEKGVPVEGALVFAFTSPAMVGRPLYVSDRTDRNGRYVLRVCEGGTYYLRVRNNYGGGPPQEKEIMGTYGDDGSVVVKTGETKKGIAINAYRFPGRGFEK